MRAPVFARCEECLHASMQRAASACGLCGGATREEAAPADVFSGWRCDCYHCVSTPC
ncbi:MAG TPA: hypothetical protein VM370_12850 [Candidatus Thermoplasmatota archaeon]|nr:hypothetical protein [Candidatus Thermoplasmatota archaeon]